MSFTIIIIAITCLVSFSAFNNRDVYNKLILYPYGMSSSPAEYYRLITSGFLHADVQHLLFNMFTLYFFGKNIEFVFQQISFSGLFLILYLTGIVVASAPAMFKHRNHSYYMALGASGGVSSILFASVYYFPWARISFFGIDALAIPGIIFGVLYLAYSAYMDKKGNDNIGHDAHFWGAVYGFVFAFLVDPSHGRSFIDQLLHPSFQ